MTDYTTYGNSELIARIEELEHERNNILLYIVAKAASLLESERDTNEDTRDLLGYIDQHAPEAHERWGKQV